MSRRNWVAVVGLTLGMAILTGCSGQATGVDKAPASTPAGKNAPASTGSVSAEAFVTPLRHVDLSFERGGRVVEVLVKDGDSVKAGQVLARLDDADAQAQLAAAQAGLVRAQAALAQVKAGSTGEQVAQAQAAVARASAALAQTAAGPTKEQIAVAEARVRTLQAQVDSSLAGARPEQKEASAAQVLQAEAAVRLAQANYDKVAYAVDPMAGQPAAVALQDATLKLQAVKANHQALLNGPTSGEVSILKAQVAEGQAALAQTKSGATKEQIAVSQAAVLEAEAALAQVKAGATKETIAVNDAAVKETEAALGRAKVGLDSAVIKAPFDGTVSLNGLEVGGYPSAGVPVLSLADQSAWTVETNNLTEIEVVRVAVGQPIEISIDALPGQTFAGTVTSIKPKSETKKGDVTYTVVGAFKELDKRLRWGMTAAIQIPGEK
jgi:HlyD family secretion protein